MDESIILKFRENADIKNSKPMESYMKNKFKFLGIKKPERSKLQKTYIKEIKSEKKIDWDLIFKLWDMEEREFQYLALDILDACKRYMQKDDIEKLQKLILEKSWWDSVDMIASKLVGQLCLDHPKLKEEYIRSWIQSEDIWLRRTSLLFQLKYKEKTDTAFLEDTIQENLGSDEFFINKAIGWVLREYSKTDKEWVKTFIQKNKLAPLSKKEASKYID